MQFITVDIMFGSSILRVGALGHKSQDQNAVKTANRIAAASATGGTEL